MGFQDRLLPLCLSGVFTMKNFPCVIVCLLALLNYTVGANFSVLEDDVQSTMRGGSGKTCSVFASTCTACATHTTCFPQFGLCSSTGGASGCATAGGLSTCMSGGAGCYDYGSTACGGPREPVCMPTSYTLTNNTNNGDFAVSACGSTCNFSNTYNGCPVNCTAAP